MSEFKLSVLIVRESVPPDVAITSQISDLVIIDRTATPAKVVLLDAACDRKLAGYELLALDIKDNGYSVANMPLEVGCRGVIDKRNTLTLETICNLVGININMYSSFFVNKDLLSFLEKFTPLAKILHCPRQ